MSEIKKHIQTAEEKANVGGQEMKNLKVWNREAWQIFMKIINEYKFKKCSKRSYSFMKIEKYTDFRI